MTASLTVLALGGLTGCQREVTVERTGGSSRDGAVPVSESDGASGSSGAAGAAGEQGRVLPGLPRAASGGNGTAGRGYDMPAIPEIVIPDFSLVDEGTQRYLTKLSGLVNPIKGIVVTQARCDGSSVVTRAGINFENDGDGSGNYIDTEKGVQIDNDGDGSGHFYDTKNGLQFDNNGDGSGHFYDTKNGLQLDINGDGSGHYYDTKNGLQININGDGSGHYYDVPNGIQINNNGDGSGHYYDVPNGIQIDYDGEGSGHYYDTKNLIQIDNDGDGTGAINGVDAEMEPLPLVPTIGTIPPIKDLAPLGTACGTLIRLEDRVLFDFDKATLRPEAGDVLDKVATALKDVDATLRVNGHTDSLGTDSYNQDLSERRAQAVADALATRGVGADLAANGLGEKQPIALNSIKGKDNPAGRQLNRRVEIIIPN